ncbi:MAG TPA: hypothetical protein PKH58_10790 [Paludibacteraceae bacterium]|nr:hypothetical protein [Paludibacteraceae bacterium]
MKRNKLKYFVQVSGLILAMVITSCSQRDLNSLDPAINSTTAEVYTDGLSGGEDFNAWGKATDGIIDFSNTDEVYSGSKSIKIEVPTATDPDGSWAGGVIFTKGSPRNLTAYNALAFYVKASMATKMTAGFGTPASGPTPHAVTYTNFNVTTVWKKIIIPIPNPSVLTSETGMFNYALPGGTTPYQVYIDDVKYENLGDEFYPVSINCDSVYYFTGDYPVSKMTFTQTFSMPNGDNATFNTSSAYYTLSDIANTSIATMSTPDILSILSAGTTSVKVSAGSFSSTFNLKSTGIVKPPVPTQNASAVSAVVNSGGKYTCNTIDTWWAGATIINAINVGGHNLFKLSNLDWCCMVMNSSKMNVSTKTKLHLDIMVPATVASKTFIVELKNNDTSLGGQTTNITLAPNTWMPIDLDISGKSPKTAINLIVFSGTIGNVFIDNVYFY